MEKLNNVQYQARGIRVISLSGNVGWNATPEIRKEAISILEAPSTKGILVSCEQLSRLNSDGIGLLVALQIRCVTTHKHFGVCDLPKKFCSFFKTMNLDKIFNIYSTRSEALQILLDSPASTKTTEGHSEEIEHTEITKQNFLQPAIRYFTRIQQQLVSEKKQSIDTPDGWFFEEYSLDEALAFCEQLQNHLDHLSEEELQHLQTLHPFYKSPTHVLEKLKLLFAGSIGAKEQIVRIYANKSFGTYKIIQSIVEAENLFIEESESETVKITRSLQNYAERSLKRLKNLLPSAAQQDMRWSQKSLFPNLQKIMNQPELFFKTDDNQQLMARRFRTFIFALYADKSLLLYLDWKHKYLRHWLYTELYLLDLVNMQTSGVQVPYNTKIKVKVYQQLEQAFMNLPLEDRSYDKSKHLTKTRLSIMQRGEAFFPEAEPLLYNNLNKSRDAEKALLDSLTPNQVATIAEMVQKEMKAEQKNRPVSAQTAANSSTESENNEMSSVHRAEKHYTEQTIQAQVEVAKVESPHASGTFLKTLNQFAEAFKQGFKKTPVPAESAPAEAIQTIPRTAGVSPGSLKAATVDWVGFGKVFRSTVYDAKIPSLQRSFFNSSTAKLQLFGLYQDCAETIFNHYSQQGALQQVSHETNVIVAGRDVIRNFKEEAIYIKTDAATCLVLGRAAFSKTMDAVIYFQLYRRHAARPYTGSNKRVDFSRKVDGVNFALESFEEARLLRPLLFHHLIRLIDSLPDPLRDAHQPFLEQLHQFETSS